MSGFLEEPQLSASPRVIKSCEMMLKSASASQVSGDGSRRFASIFQRSTKHQQTSACFDYFSTCTPQLKSTMSRCRVSKANSRHSSNTSTHRSQLSSSRGPVDLSLSSSRDITNARGPDDVNLTPERKAKMLKDMRESEKHVVDSMIGGQTLWKLRMHRKGISYFVDENVDKGHTRFCCVGMTDAPVANIMQMFLVTNTETLLKNVRIMYRNVKEARILSVLQPATRTNPMRSVYIRYASFDTPTLMCGRDICVCVCTDMRTMADGSTVGYCLWDSVDIPECPDRYDSDRIIRSRMKHSGFIFRNSGNLTKVCYLIGVDIGGIAPQLTGRIYMTLFGGICRRVCQHYLKQLDPEIFTRRAEWKPKHEAKECPECRRRFNPLVKRLHCVSCGEVVCGRCCCMTEVSVRGAMVTRVRICATCLQKAGMLRTNLHSIAARDDLDSLSSDGSGVRDLLRGEASSRSSPVSVTP
ncbi:unnamed protein product [Phytophthora lilii]|uniref:Unnamed protein product n=1 Tax=Phytophthora lilii TaxID=2077276 RepID=A0A9W6WVE2_9STRA|nr:unnamed protein product [Phytophthora lilii]